MFSRLFARADTEEEKALNVYAAIVAQARHPNLYRQFGVPDTPEGRLEMILLHAVILFHRLRREGAEGEAMSQSVFDVFIGDMDRSLREMGVGDLGVPKRMKAIGRSFYGRADAYGEPISKSDPAGLANAIQRNLFPEESSEAGPSARDLARYALAASAALSERSMESIAAARLDLPAPAANRADEADG